MVFHIAQAEVPQIHLYSRTVQKCGGRLFVGGLPFIQQHQAQAAIPSLAQPLAFKLDTASIEHLRQPSRCGRTEPLSHRKNHQATIGLCQHAPLFHGATQRQRGSEV